MAGKVATKRCENVPNPHNRFDMTKELELIGCSEYATGLKQIGFGERGAFSFLKEEVRTAHLTSEARSKSRTRCKQQRHCVWKYDIQRRLASVVSVAFSSVSLFRQCRFFVSVAFSSVSLSRRCRYLVGVLYLR